MSNDKKPPTNAFASLKAVAQPTIPEAPAAAQADANVVQLSQPHQEKTPPAATPTPTARVPKAKKFVRPGRAGMKVIAIHVDPQMARQLKILAAETDSTIQQLVEDAVREKLRAAGKRI
jgi:hypothetical protein